LQIVFAVLVDSFEQIALVINPVDDHLVEILARQIVDQLLVGPNPVVKVLISRRAVGIIGPVPSNVNVQFLNFSEECDLSRVASKITINKLGFIFYKKHGFLLLHHENVWGLDVSSGNTMLNLVLQAGLNQLFRFPLRLAELYFFWNINYPKKVTKSYSLFFFDFVLSKFKKSALYRG